MKKILYGKSVSVQHRAWNDYVRSSKGFDQRTLRLILRNERATAYIKAEASKLVLEEALAIVS